MSTESILVKVLKILNKNKNEYKLAHKFGDTYIQKNNVNVLNVTHMENTSPEYIVSQVEKKVGGLQ